jgi:hypothetical protein
MSTNGSGNDLKKRFRGAPERSNIAREIIPFSSEMVRGGCGPVLSFSISAFVLIFLAVAFAQTITVEFDQTRDFGQYKTFAIRNGQLNSKNPALNSELVKKRIELDIERALTARGLTMVSGKSDLNVVYRFGSARGTEVETYPAGWRGWGTRVVRVPFAEGTLVIDLRDPSTRSLVWRGIASEKKSEARKLESKLDDMVRKSLEKYPPKPK